MRKIQSKLVEMADPLVSVAVQLPPNAALDALYNMVPRRCRNTWRLQLQEEIASRCLAYRYERTVLMSWIIPLLLVESVALGPHVPPRTSFTVLYWNMLNALAFPCN